MTFDLRQLGQARIANLVPLDSLGADGFRLVIERTLIQRLPARTRLFEQGDEDEETFYLLQGEVELVARDGGRTVVKSETDSARYALANLKPRRYTGTALEDITIARLNSRILDRMLSWDQIIRGTTASYEVTEISGGEADGAWMRKLIQNPVFRRLPVANLQALFARMKRVEFASEELLLQQGAPGDYYYIIAQGACLVSRKSDVQANTIELAVLNEGDGFGEEALLSGETRNASVVALTGVVLMRLAKDDFLKLLGEPLVQRVGAAELGKKVRAGASLIDVRLESEFAHGSLPGAINVPLYLLRLKMRAVPAGKPCIVFCDTGARSAAAAFLLSERGFDALVLEGGLARYTKGMR